MSFKSNKDKTITWGQLLGDPECPYAKRWVLTPIKGGPSFRIHHFMRSDDKRYFHDHPWAFFTFVFKGGYTDVSEHGRDHLHRFSIRRRSAYHRHTVEIDPGGVWTLVITGPYRRKWGFWVDGRFVGVREYFRQYGHPPCDEL